MRFCLAMLSCLGLLLPAAFAQTNGYQRIPAVPDDVFYGRTVNQMQPDAPSPAPEAQPKPKRHKATQVPAKAKPEASQTPKTKPKKATQAAAKQAPLKPEKNNQNLTVTQLASQVATQQQAITKACRSAKQAANTKVKRQQVAQQCQQLQQQLAQAQQSARRLARQNKLSAAAWRRSVKPIQQATRQLNSKLYPVAAPGN